LAYFFALVLLFAITSYVYLQDYLKTNVKNEKIVYIPKGSTKSVCDYFNKKGYDINLLDYYIIKHYYGYPQAGWIDLKKKNLTRKEFFYKITHSHAMGINITIVPGETTDIVLKQISKKYSLSVTKLHTLYKELAPYPEGVIFPETYTFYKGIDEKKLIKLLLSSSLKKHKRLSKKYLGEYKQKEWFEKYITIASIVQKEAANKKEMPKVAAVIYNRLKKGMKLQMDGTLNYGENSHKKVTAKQIREDKSLFNTYKIKGLPPYPVCLVQKSAILAALKPDKNSYLYFVKKDKNSHYFSKTYKEHIKNIKK